MSRRQALTTLAGMGLLSVSGCLDTNSGTSTKGGTSSPTSSSTNVNSKQTAADESPYTIEWTVQGATTVVPEDENLLDVALEEGLDVPYHCGLGVCGQCTSKVPGDGTDYVEHDGNQYLTDEQVAAGFVLTCVAYPRRDFEITTGKQRAADSV